VVADYFGIGFLQTRHHVAATRGEAAALALRAGIDVELPTVRCYGTPLIELVRRGEVPEELLDRAAARVLTLKAELGLLDGLPDEDAEPQAPELDFDPPEHRALARRLAEESVVLLANDGALPLRSGDGVVLAGPLAEDPFAVMGCDTFPRHGGRQHPDLPLGGECPTRVAGSRDVYVADDADIEAAVAAARDAELCVLALGDRAGLFGRGTSGEGCDIETLTLPGRQAELAAAVLDTGTPTVLVLLTGRPYALEGLADRAAAVVQAFLPGEEG